MPEKFLVPQYIEVESKIFGPITIRQFVELIVAAIFIFIAYKLLSTIFFIIAAIFIVIFFGALAFGKVNENPMHIFFLNMVYTLKRPKIRIWMKKITVTEADVKIPVIKSTGPLIAVKKDILPDSRLGDLSLLVDTGGVYKDFENK